MRYPIAALTLAVLASQTWAGEGYTAKSLFFAQDDSVVAVSTAPKQAGGDSATALASSQGTSDALPSAENTGKIVKVARKKKATKLGASYFIRLKNPDGTTHDVLAKRVFKSGEHFQLGVKVNRPSYVYILNQAPDGKVTQIYPQPSQDNFIDAMGVVFFPAKGSFVFDDKPGMEKLLVFVTSEREHDDVSRRINHVAPDLVSTAPALNTADGSSCPATSSVAAAAPAPDATEPLQIADAGTGYVSKGIVFANDQDAPCATNMPQDPSPGYKAKGIVFADDPAPPAGGQVASYVVKQTTQPDADLYLKINLAHE